MEWLHLSNIEADPRRLAGGPSPAPRTRAGCIPPLREKHISHSRRHDGSLGAGQINNNRRRRGDYSRPRRPASILQVSVENQG